MEPCDQSQGKSRGYRGRGGFGWGNQQVKAEDSDTEATETEGGSLGNKSSTCRITNFLHINRFLIYVIPLDCMFNNDLTYKVDLDLHEINV